MTDRFAVLMFLRNTKSSMSSQMCRNIGTTCACLSFGTCRTNQINSINLGAIVNNIDNTLLASILAT